MSTTQALAACLIMASQTYEVPPAVMIGIMHVEGGRVGQQVGNSNGSYDLGPMQVNTVWVPQLAKSWKVSHKQAHMALRDDGCLNIKVSAWILSQKIKQSGSLYGGIAHYNSATPGIGQRYASKVVTVMYKKGLIRKNSSVSNIRTTATDKKQAVTKTKVITVTQQPQEQKYLLAQR